MNCWKYEKCGREKSGVNEKALGVCPAYPDHGKDCALVSGTLCGGTVQGTFTAKFGGCTKCDFYKSAYYNKNLNIRDFQRKFGFHS